MRIGFEAKRATHNFRGLGNYSRGLIEGIKDYHQEQELILYYPPIKNLKTLSWLNSLNGNIQLRTPNTFFTKSFPSLWRSFLLADDIKKDNLDIFHGLSHEIPLRLEKMPVKKVVTMHDLIFLRYPEFFPWIDRVVYAQKFNYACKNSDVVIAICKQTKDDLIQFLNVDERKIKIHYQSCSPLFYDLVNEDSKNQLRSKFKLEKPFILNVGAFEERKNQLTLLEAYSLICDKIEEDLVFVGQGKSYKEKVLARAKALKIEDRVKILSSIQNEELPVLYQAAQLFCYPSLFEGFGIPIVESLFSCTPVITSLGSVFPESAGPDAVFIDPNSPSEIASAIIQVLKSSTLRLSMIQRGREYAQRFHRKESTDALLDIYSQVLS